MKHAEKKFKFIKDTDYSEDIKKKILNNLIVTFDGKEGEHDVKITPLGKACDPVKFITAWNRVYDSKRHLLNKTLQDLEQSQRSKFSPRSIQVPWSERKEGVKASYRNQSDKYDNPDFCNFEDPNDLTPLDLDRAVSNLKESKSSGLPFLTSKGKAFKDVLQDWKKYLARKDPAMLYTRTESNRKTRNVWGYPIADTILEAMFFQPWQIYERTLPYRKAMVHPDDLAKAVTKIILKAIETGRVILSIDFIMFDASVRCQYILKAFDRISRAFPSQFKSTIDYIAGRFISIAIMTPDGILRGLHAIPSGSMWTNTIGSIIQLGIALTCAFLCIDHIQVQGDDGIYMLYRDEVDELCKTFEKAGLNVSLDKSHIGDDYAIFCQNLYHIDYIKPDGVIYGIYPVYRAICHLIYMESYTDFSKVDVSSKDYYGIRTISILEHCKHHPLFEDLVRFVFAREKYKLDFTEDGLVKYSTFLNLPVGNLNQQYGSNVTGIRNFETFKIVQKIIAEEELCS